MPQLVKMDLPAFPAYLASRRQTPLALKKMNRGEAIIRTSTSELLIDKQDIRAKMLSTRAASEQRVLSLSVLDLPELHGFTDTGLDFFNELGESNQTEVFGE